MRNELERGTKPTALIVGAGSGLGLESALYLAEKGYAVWGSVLNAKEGAACDQEAQRRQVLIRVLRMDVTKRHEIDGAIRVLVEEAGQIDALVHFAGVGLSGFFEDLSLDEVRRLYDVNVFGVMAVTQAVLPHMRAARAGRIVIASSVLGRIGAIAVSGYASSKFAVEGFAECLAAELAPFGIHVSLLEPSLIRTPMFGVNRNRAKGATNPSSPYYPWFRQHEQIVNGLLYRSRLTAVDVAQMVHTILTSSRPRLRYVVGAGAKFMLSLRRHIPGEFLERLWFSFIRRRVAPLRQQANRLG
jgi:NAD(P)-dependent dehydrogenase (short-subunit alcohol dehydrogenase family)